MNILITGGTGFIGKILVAKLLENGNNVIVLTRDKKNADPFTKEKIKILESDICNFNLLEKSLSEIKNIDSIIHLAAYMDYFGDKKTHCRVNVSAVSNLLNAAYKFGIKKFIFTSSIEAMGTIKEKNIPADENLICKPVSSYGKSKKEAEEIITDFTNHHDIHACILRLGNVYGPGGAGFIVPMAKAILNHNDKLMKYLAAYKNRYYNFVYIDDVVNGILSAIKKNIKNDIFILAGKEIVTLEEIYILIAKSLNVDFKPQFAKSRKDEILLFLRELYFRLNKKADLLTYFAIGNCGNIHRAYSIEKAKNELGYDPKVNLIDGITKTIKWAKEQGFFGDKT